jgi:hypothetical protein
VYPDRQDRPDCPVSRAWKDWKDPKVKKANLDLKDRADPRATEYDPRECDASRNAQLTKTFVLVFFRAKWECLVSPVSTAFRESRDRPDHLE